MFGLGKKKESSKEHRAPSADAPEAPQATLDELDRLREAVLAGRQHAQELAFWRAALRLPSWHMVAAADLEALQRGALPPMLTLKQGDGMSMLPVFSTAERATRAMVEINGKSGAPFAILSEPVGRAIARLVGMRKSVSNVVFDRVGGAINGYGTQADALASMYDYFVGPAPLPCLAALSALAVRTRDRRDLVTAYRCLAQAKAIHLLIDNPKDRICYLKLDEGVTAFAFTDPAEAEATRDRAGDVRILSGTLAEVLPMHGLASKQVGEPWRGFLIDPSSARLLLVPDLAAQALAHLEMPGEQIHA